MKTRLLTFPVCWNLLRRMLHCETKSQKIEKPKQPLKRSRRHITTTFFEMP